MTLDGSVPSERTSAVSSPKGFGCGWWVGWVGWPSHDTTISVLGIRVGALASELDRVGGGRGWGMNGNVAAADEP